MNSQPRKVSAYADSTPATSCIHPVKNRRLRRDKIEIYIHLIWTTWDREFLLTPELEWHLFPLLIEIGERHNAATVILNGVPDHLHWLVKISSTTRLCDMVKDAKGISSRFLNEQLGNFKWRPTYAAFSVSSWNVAQIAQYITEQNSITLARQ